LIRISLQLEGFVVRSVYFRKKSVYCFFSLLCFNVFLAFLKIQGLQHLLIVLYRGFKVCFLESFDDFTGVV